MFFNSLLEYFIFQSVPNIELIDHSTKDKYDLNAIFSGEFYPSLKVSNFTIKGKAFTIHDVLIRIPHEREHQAHFCANKRVVESERLTDKIPHIDDKGLHDDTRGTLFYSAYVSSPFLDEMVDSDRTSFQIARKPSPLISAEVSWQDILDNVVNKSKDFLKPFTAQASEEILERVKKYVETEEPKYRYLLSSHRDAVQDISPMIPDAKLARELHEIHFRVTTKLKHDISEHLAQENNEITDWESHKNQFRNIFKRLTEVTNSELAEYIMHRKTVLSFLEKILGRDDDGRYAKEEAIHEIIFPLRKTSDDVTYDDHNLWIVDERLVYHHYLASDISFKRQDSSPIELENDSRPDILIFNKAFALAEGDRPFNSIVIIEFKRPERSDYDQENNPISQIYDYIGLIREGKAKDKRGITIQVSSSIPFYCYIIATITPKLKKEAAKSDLTPTPDGLGYFGYNQNYDYCLSSKNVMLEAFKQA